MKRLIRILPFVVCGVGAWIMVSTVINHQKMKQEMSVDAPHPILAVALDAETYAPQDQELVQQVFDEPELLDSHSVTAASVVAPDSNLSPALMSSQFQGTEKGMADNEVTEVQVTSPMIESFASLRTDAVRNPESEQNRAAVKSIMAKRQRRVAELEQR